MLHGATLLLFDFRCELVGDLFYLLLIMGTNANFSAVLWLWKGISNL